MVTDQEDFFLITGFLRNLLNSSKSGHTLMLSSAFDLLQNVVTSAFFLYDLNWFLFNFNVVQKFQFFHTEMEKLYFYI